MIKSYEEIDIDIAIVMRVAKENLWSVDFALKVREEYKKFLYMSTFRSVAPSFEVDQMWHVHLIYSVQYEQFEKLIGKKLYHIPNIKSEVKTKGKDDYTATLEFYRELFGEPPLDIWTKYKDSYYVNIDLNSHWVIPVGDWRSLIKVLFKHIRYGIF